MATLQLFIHTDHSTTTTAAATKKPPPSWSSSPQQYLFCKTKFHRFIPHASSSLSRRQLISTHTAATISILASNLFQQHPSQAAAAAGWKPPHLPLVHIVFLPHHYTHGVLLGAGQIFFESEEGGSKWMPHSLLSGEEQDFIYWINAFNFEGKEGGGIEKPAILLYTSGVGENRKPIRLGSQLAVDKHYSGDHSKSRTNEKPRFFDSKGKSVCWAKASIVPGRHPDRWRKDAVGNVICKRFHGCEGCLCYEYDHIIPFSKGGPSTSENCQILQTRVNRLKSDKGNVMTQLKGYSCDIHFTNEQLDIIEMAVYGDVLRPGNRCRVGTINEMHGKYKSRDPISTCKFP